MNTILHFTLDFPKGAMLRDGPWKLVPTKWIAVGVTCKAPAVIVTTEDIPAGSTLIISETIPDTYATVSPFQGTGSVAGFTNSYTLTITPPKP